MSEIVDVVLPVFALIGMGYGVARSRLLPDATGDALSGFVFVVAVPFLIFRTIGTAEFAGTSPWGLWFAYFTAMACAWAAGTMAMRLLFGCGATIGVVGGFLAAYGNNVMIGIPLVLAAFGEEGIVATLLLVAVHLPITMTVSTVLIGRALRSNERNPGDVVAIARVLLMNLVTNPVLIGVIAALFWRLSGAQLSGLPALLIGRLADVAGTVALFAVGMSIRKHGIAHHALQAAALSVIKLVAMPLIVFVLAFHVVSMPAVWAKAMVLTAACPTGIYAFVAANRFQTGEALSSTTITISTAAAFTTVTFWLAVLQCV